jgi:hypothetical protein
MSKNHQIIRSILPCYFLLVLPLTALQISCSNSIGYKSGDTAPTSVNPNSAGSPNGTSVNPNVTSGPNSAVNPSTSGELSLRLTAEAGSGPSCTSLAVQLVDTVTHQSLDVPRVLAPRSSGTQLEVDWDYLPTNHALALMAYVPQGGSCSGTVTTLAVQPVDGLKAQVIGIALADLLAGQTAACSSLPSSASVRDDRFDLTVKVSPGSASAIPLCQTPLLSLDVLRASDRQLVFSQRYNNAGGVQMTVSNVLERNSDYLISLTGIVNDAPSVDPNCIQTLWNGNVLASANYALPQYTSRYTLGNTNTTVDPQASLVVTKLSVVDDPVRTQWSGNLATGSDGAWHMGRLLAQSAGAKDPQAFVAGWLGDLASAPTLNSFPVAASSKLSTQWPRVSGNYNLLAPPVNLLGIINRIDLRRPSAGLLAELRLDYGTFPTLGAHSPFSNNFKVIFEYEVMAAGKYDIKAWAQGWHALSRMTGDPNAYSAQLEKLTTFVTQATQPIVVRVRTGEESDQEDWVFRQFEIDAQGNLVSVPTSLTPDLKFNRTRDPNDALAPDIAANQQLADFINGQKNSILTGTYTVPLAFAGQPFLGGSSTEFPNYFVTIGRMLSTRWDVYPSIAVDANALAIFSTNTCNGCHGIENFPEMLGNRYTALHPLNPAGPFFPGRLSGFFSGSGMSTGRFNELLRRSNDLQAVLWQNAGTVDGTGITFPGRF